MRIRRSAIGLFLCAILGANTQFTNANAATFASGTPCEVIVSDISNLTYSHNSGTRQCTYTFSYNATVRTITLPTNLVSATITLTGARGGQGGPRTTMTASKSSYVGQFSGSIPLPSNKQIEIYTGEIGTNGTNPVRDSIFHSGPAGGASHYASGGNGGSGGGQRGAYVTNYHPSGTGGGGGGATVALINSIPIFAGGGGGTGGTGRANSNANLEGGSAYSDATSQTSQTNGVTGEDNTYTDNNTSCQSNAGAGGGGGGGYQGGNRGEYGTSKCDDPKSFIPSTGGYPGSNGTTYSLTSTSSSYVSRSTDTTDSTAYGSVVIVLVYKGTTTATLSIPAGNLVYRQATTISNTSTVAGKITFRANGKILPGCKNKAATANVAVTCSYKPSTRNSVIITATLDPTDPDFIGTVSVSAQLQVANRTGPRIR